MSWVLSLSLSFSVLPAYPVYPSAKLHHKAHLVLTMSPSPHPRGVRLHNPSGPSLPSSLSSSCSSSWPLPASNTPCSLDFTVFIGHEKRTEYYHSCIRREPHDRHSTETGQDIRRGCSKKQTAIMAPPRQVFPITFITGIVRHDEGESILVPRHPDTQSMPNVEVSPGLFIRQTVHPLVTVGSVITVTLLTSMMCCDGRE